MHHDHVVFRYKMSSSSVLLNVLDLNLDDIIEYSKMKREVHSSQVANLENFVLTVHNLHTNVIPADLESIFRKFGTAEVVLGSDRADVLFDRKSDALRAGEFFDGVPLAGRPMMIEVRRASNVVCYGLENVLQEVGEWMKKNGTRKRDTLPTKEQLDRELDEYWTKKKERRSR